jgi:hypothetical protein
MKPGLIEDLMVLRHHAAQNKGPISEVVTSAESLVGFTETSDGIEIGIEDTRASVAADSNSVADDWDYVRMLK